MRTHAMFPIQPQIASRRRAQRGMTLVEALVAIFIFSIAFLTAMMLYQTANRTYMRTDAAAVQQQNVRFALDRMSETLRDAGAGHNMLGSSRLADEQIEGAWQSAIFVRGDFDGQRETALESATYPIITTGNDEIVGYVLRKKVPEDGPDPNTISISILADFAPKTGRDSVYTTQTSIAGEETKNIQVAALNVAQQTDPPYRLERVTWDEDGNIKYEVIMENVFRMSLRYFEDDVTVQPITASTGIGSANTERDERGRVRRIEVSITGMTDRPDLGYKDETVYTPAVPEFTKGHRKFTVTQMIYSPNLGVIGSAHNASLPLSLDAPTYITACGGHCRRYLISWPASPSAGVTTYRLEITAPASGSMPAYSAPPVDVTGLFYEFHEPEDDVEAGIFRPFSFRVAPLSGTLVGTYTQAVAVSSSNPSASTPQTVQNVSAAQSGSNNALRVTWDAVTQNTGTVTDNTCMSAGAVVGGSAPPSPWNSMAVDLKESKVYRARFNGLNTGADVTDDITDLVLGELTNDAASDSFVDNTAAPCSSYFYRVKACDVCDVMSPAMSEPMITPVKFDLPNGVNPAKPPTPTPVGTVSVAGGNYVVQLEWAPVTRTDADEKAAVSHYVLERWRRIGAVGTYTIEPAETQHIYDAHQSAVDTAPTKVGGQDAYYQYYLKAVYDCSVARTSVPSDPFELSCIAPPGNTMTLVQPPDGDVITRPGQTIVPIVVSTTGSGWTSATLQITADDGSVVYGPVDGTLAANSFTFPSWDVSNDDVYADGDYTLTVTGMVGNCTTSTPAVSNVTLETVTCGQRIVPTTPTPWTGNGANQFTGFTFRIENTCPFAVTFNSMRPNWQDVSNVTDLNSIRIGTTTLYTGAVKPNGSVVPLSQPVTLAAAGVTPSLSNQMSFGFDDNFTHNNTQNGTPGKFNSILINVTAPQPSSEQLVDLPPIP